MSTTTRSTPEREAAARSGAFPRAAAALLAPITAAALALAPSPALAHDVLTGSTPEDGQTLETVPEEVALTFNNPPAEGGGGTSIVVTGPDGETTYEEGEPSFDGTDVSTVLTPLDQAGEYSIGYRVVSSDGHPIQGTLTFSVTEGAVAEAAPEPEEESAQESPAPPEDAGEESAAGADANEAGAEQEAEGGVSPTALAILAAVAIAGVAAVVLVAVRMRNRPGGDASQG